MQTIESTQDAPATTPATIKLADLPKIGTAFAGGIYAGIIGGTDKQPDYALIHATVDFELFDMNWQDAITRAQEPINNLTDWSLPNRREARLLSINTRDSFDVGDWYWTNEQHANSSDYAWMQSFDYGGQDYLPKSYEGRARAVRRLLIIQ
ncbi:Lcl C-terminal domain-containing protein [Undibacterium macrobrachii]|uniref:Lcl C-terminal domain-containing protein n=1 Tax=Undibacterium macrobrachii TaxID=1119058 RepID=A0ABQ2X6C3_9BURK|nr:DUF1566 domain-containing protein [Undibacterium macrobrachii]GGX01663.1 hypothetical protein GCM10011282_04510 [Undibacterium macrobrachii]